MLSMLAPAHPFDLLDAAMADAIAFPRMPTHAFARPTSASPTLRDDNTHFTLVLAAPGVAPSDLTITAAEGKIHIKGETKSLNQTHSINISVALPEDADAMNGASATSTDGMIAISLPKIVSPAPARITVSTTRVDEDADASDDVHQTTRPYKLTLVAAGLAPADVHITAERDVLTVMGETKSTGARIRRQMKLPRDADVSDATACSVDGILTISVPKKPKSVPKRLVVNLLDATTTDAEASPEAAADAASEENTQAKMDEEEDAVMVSSDY